MKPLPTEKECTKCHKVKPIADFRKKYKELHYRQSACKPCANAMTKDWLARKRAEARARIAAKEVEARDGV